MLRGDFFRAQGGRREAGIFGFYDNKHPKQTNKQKVNKVGISYNTDEGGCEIAWLGVFLYRAGGF